MLADITFIWVKIIAVHFLKLGCDQPEVLLPMHLGCYEPADEDTCPTMTEAAAMCQYPAALQDRQLGILMKVNKFEFSECFQLNFTLCLPPQ